MENKSKGPKVVQILFSIIGIIGLGWLIFLFAGCMKDMSADAAATILAIIILFPLALIISLVPVIAGAVVLPVSIHQRKKEEVKTKFSLTMLIIGIALIALPIIIDALLLIIPQVANS